MIIYFNHLFVKKEESENWECKWEMRKKKWERKWEMRNENVIK